jgi:hypothetical protein
MSSAVSLTPLIGSQSIGNFNIPDTTQRHPLGARLAAFDTYYGSGEYIYLLNGATALPTATVVQWDKDFVAVANPATANTGAPVGFTGQNPAVPIGAYFWAQVTGKLPVLSATSVAALTPIGIHASTAGSLNTMGNGRQLLNANVVLAATGTIVKTAQTLNGSSVLKVTDASGWFQGLVITGTGIPASTIVGTIAADNKTVTMYQSGGTTVQNATATGSVSVTGTLTGYVLIDAQNAFVQGQTV